MSYIDLIVERQIAEAIARGEMEGGPLKGKPLDMDEMRPPGWWAEQLVRRERSRVISEDFKSEHAAWQRRFWNAGDADAVSLLVEHANAAVDAANARMLDADAFDRFDEGDILARWRHARRPSSTTQVSTAIAARRRWFHRG